jgi:hypothetical protein
MRQDKVRSDEIMGEDEDERETADHRSLPQTSPAAKSGDPETHSAESDI